MSSINQHQLMPCNSSKQNRVEFHRESIVTSGNRFSGNLNLNGIKLSFSWNNLLPLAA